MAIDVNNLNPHRRIEDRRSSAPASKPGNDTVARERAESRDSADSVEFSHSARTLRSLAANARQISQVDVAKVDTLRRQIADGQYHVDAERLAQKFLELERELSQ